MHSQQAGMEEVKAEEWIQPSYQSALVPRSAQSTHGLTQPLERRSSAFPKVRNQNFHLPILVVLIRELVYTCLKKD